MGVAEVVEATPGRRSIPQRAHDYRLGARSALDWVVDQQQVKTDKPSGIVNDSNDWADEQGDPLYLRNSAQRRPRALEVAGPRRLPADMSGADHGRPAQARTA